MTHGPMVPKSLRVMNLAGFVDQAADRHAGRVAFIWGERTWTWAELNRRICAIAYALKTRFGVQKGDRILVQSKNCNQMFESMFACFRLGAVWVPTNFRQTPEEVAYQAEVSGAIGMICSADFPDHQAACETVVAIRFWISIGAASFGPDFDALADDHMGQRVEVAAVERDDPCWFLFTSGTTGRPKAAVLTHGQMTFVINNHLCDLMPGTTEADASLVVAPLSHGAGVHQLTQVARGAATVLLSSDRLDIEEAWSLIQTWRISNLFTVPTILKMMIEHPAVDRYDHSSLRYVIYAGAPMYRVDQTAALQKLGPVLVQYYGLGEVTGNITVLPPSQHMPDGPLEARSGTCGFARTGMQICIMTPEGVELPAGQTGEICVVGPAVFAGYYNNPEANENAFRDGWFRTGDIGHLDRDGFLYITGRASDMYISGGSNIYPREIEEKLLAHPDIREVAVVGVPDPLWGEIGVAVCVFAEGGRMSVQQLGEWLDGKIARYKLPKRYEFWSELPKSGYGKVAKGLIRNRLLVDSAVLPPSSGGIRDGGVPKP